MRRFIIQSLLFAVVASAMIYAVYRLVISNRDRLFVEPGVETVFFGNSTVEFGVDDALIPNSLNLGLNADHLEYIYAKIKLLHRNNPTLQTVVLGFDNALLFKDTSGEHSATINHPFYYGCYDWPDAMAVMRYSDYDWWQNYLTQPLSIAKIRVPLVSMADQDVDIRQLGIGMSGQLFGTMDSIPIPDSISYNTNLMDSGVDTRLSLYFLDRIRDYARQNDLNLVFLTMPNLRTNDMDTSYRCIRHKYYGDIPHIDLYCDTLSPAMFRDVAHLNVVGRDSVTRQIGRYLRLVSGKMRNN